MQTVLNEELNNVSDWLRANKLSLNVSKSRLMDFSKKQNPKSLLSAKIENQEIELANCAKYLGILIDNKMSYKNQISAVSKKINNRNSILYKLRHFIPDKDIKNVYYAHIHSHINYGIGAWGGATKSNFTKIIRKQKKISKHCFFQRQNKNT